MKKTHIKKLDSLWATAVKLRDKHTCRYCFDDNACLNACHIKGRRYRATRWRLDNGMCLCFNCHMEYDEHGPNEESIRKHVVGDLLYEELNERAKHNVTKYQVYEDIKNELETLITSFNSLD